MRSTMLELDPATVQLTIEVPFEELPDDHAALRAFARTYADGTFDGTALPPAFVTAVTAGLRSALAEHRLVPMDHPEVRITGFGDATPLIASVLVHRRPPVVLPPLAHIAVDIPHHEPADLAVRVDDMLLRLRREYADLAPVDRPAGAGDFMRLDLRATVDGATDTWEPAGDVLVEVGSAGVIAGLSEALIDRRAGESVTVEAPVPAGPDAGRAASVTAMIRAVLEPREAELGDELAAAAGPYADLAELRRHLHATLRRNERADRLAAAEEAALSAVVAAAAVTPPPGSVDQRAAWLRQHTGGDQDLRDEAAGQLGREIVLDAIADAEDLQVGVDELREAITRDFEASGVSARTYRKHLARPGVAGAIHAALRREKALAHLVRTVVFHDTAGNVLTFDEL